MVKRGIMNHSNAVNYVEKHISHSIQDEVPTGKIIISTWRFFLKNLFWRRVAKILFRGVATKLSNIFQQQKIFTDCSSTAHWSECQVCKWSCGRTGKLGVGQTPTCMLFVNSSSSRTPREWWCRAVSRGRKDYLQPIMWTVTMQQICVLVDSCVFLHSNIGGTS